MRTTIRPPLLAPDPKRGREGTRSPGRTDPPGAIRAVCVPRPKGSALSVYMQPRGLDDPLWELTIPSRDYDVTMGALQLGGLASVVLDAARLCTYLQFRSLEWDRGSGRHRTSSHVGVDEE